MRRAILFFAILLGSIHVFSQNGKEPVLITDLLRIRTISDVELSNDGRTVTFVVTAAVPDEKNNDEHQYQSQIWIAPTDGSAEPRQITYSKDGAAQPAWSPDGSNLAFVRAVDGTSQLFIMPLSGGEPRQLTFGKNGASRPVWSPDGKQLAYTVSFNLKNYVNDSLYNPGRTLPTFSMEKAGLDNHFLLKPKVKVDPNGSIEEVRAYLEKNENDKKAKVFSKLNFQQEATTSSEYNLSHVFIINIQPGSQPIVITRGFFSFSNPAFIGNDRLVVEANRDSLQMPDRSLSGEVYTVKTDGTELTKLAGEKDRRYSWGAISDRNKWIAILNSKTSFASYPTLEIHSLQGGISPITIPYDRNKSSMAWTKDEKYLYFTTPWHGGTVMNRVDPLTRQVSALSSENEGIGSFDIKADKVVFVKTSIESPFELFVADLQMKNQRPITQLNSSWISGKKLSIPEKHSFVNSAGLEVEYWVMKPTFMEPGKKYPLLLEIHGGPSAMWGPGESSMWHEFQYFCSKGYGVVYSNPRGSGGYTEGFLRANVNDWGTGPSSDVLTALDNAVKEGWADTTKLLVTGGSYAGYLVSWIVGHDHRFAAACAQRGVYDLRTFFGEGNAWRLVPNYFGGYPWEKKTYDILERESPINYVQNVRTPLIIFHGENDLRTGVISSEQYYRSLKVMGKTVEYVRHPGATHEITRSGNNRQRIDQMLRTWEFFERFIR